LYKHPASFTVSFTAMADIQELKEKLSSRNNAPKTAEKAFDSAWIFPVQKSLYHATIGAKGWPSVDFTPKQLQFMQEHVNDADAEWKNHKGDKEFWMHVACNEDAVRPILNRLFIENTAIINAAKADLHLETKKAAKEALSPPTPVEKRADTMVTPAFEPPVLVRKETAVFKRDDLGGVLRGALDGKFKFSSKDDDDWDTAAEPAPLKEGVGALLAKDVEPEVKEPEVKEPGFLGRLCNAVVGAAVAPLPKLAPPPPPPPPAKPLVPPALFAAPASPGPVAAAVAAPASPAPPVAVSADPEVVRLNGKIAQMNQDAQKLITSIKEDDLEIKKLSKNVADLTVENEKLSKIAVELTAENKQLTDAIINHFQPTMQELKDTVAERELHIRKLEQELQTLGHNVKTKEAEITNADQVIRDLRTKCTEMNTKLCCPPMSFAGNPMKVAELEARMEEQGKELQEAVTYLQDIEEKYLASQKQNKALTQRVKELEGHGASASMQVMLVGLSEQVDRLTLERNELLERVDSPVAFKPRHVSRQDSAFGSFDAPVTRQDSREPMTRQFTREPMTRQDSSVPMTRQDSREPMTRQFTREPMTHQFTSEPMTRQDSRQPMTRFDSRASVQPMSRSSTGASRTKHSSDDPVTEAQKLINKALKNEGLRTAEVDPAKWERFLQQQAAKRH